VFVIPNEVRNLSPWHKVFEKVRFFAALRMTTQNLSHTYVAMYRRIEKRMRRPSQPGELIFFVEKNPDGGLTAKALRESIFTQADDPASLQAMIRDAVVCHFPDEQARPTVIRLQYVNEELPG